MSVHMFLYLSMYVPVHLLTVHWYLYHTHTLIILPNYLKIISKSYLHGILSFSIQTPGTETGSLYSVVSENESSFYWSCSAGFGLSLSL